jgi:SAM-dependent methyltransferase
MIANDKISLPDRCRLCGSMKLRLRGWKLGKFRAQKFSYYECGECSFLFVCPAPGPEEVYDDAYYRGDGPDPMVDYESEYRDYSKTARVHEFKDFLRLASEHLSHFGSRESIDSIQWLDFGCGAGGLLKFLRDRRQIRVGKVDRRLEMSGFDIGSYADRLASIDSFKIWSVDELRSLPPGRFHVITCIEVVEHLNEPLPVFQLLARSLAENGLLLISTGNLRSPLAKLFGIAFPYCIPEIHVGYFNPELLKNVYLKLGLTPVQVQFADALRFKFLKNIGTSLPERTALRLSNSKIFLRLLDLLFGVSAMPIAAKLKQES